MIPVQYVQIFIEIRYVLLAYIVVKPKFHHYSKLIGLSMGGVGFTFDDDFFISQWGYGSEKMKKKEKKKKKGSKGIIIIFILAIVMYLAIKYNINPISILQGNKSSSSIVEESNNNEYNEGGNTQYPVFTKKGYYTDKYIVDLDLLDTVALNNTHYYELGLTLKTNGSQKLTILSPTKEIVIYNVAKREDSIKVTVPVSRELKLKLLFRPFISFSRKFIPVIIFSNDEGSYDFLFIKTDVDKNNPFPPSVKNPVSLNVNGITHAEIVQDNVILAKFVIYVSPKIDKHTYETITSDKYIWGTIVKIELSDDSYTFAKSGSNIILVPTLTPDYTLNLYIIKETGEFTSADRIKANVILEDSKGLLIKKTTHIVITS